MNDQTKNETPEETLDDVSGGVSTNPVRRLETPPTHPGKPPVFHPDPPRTHPGPG